MTNIERELRGTYYTNFFSIFINGNFDREIEKMNHRDKGTFAHEYLHYIQNITTIYGLKTGIFQFQLLVELKKYIEYNNQITLPIGDKFMSQRILKGKEMFHLFNGTEFYKKEELFNYDVKIINKNKNKLVEITFFNEKDSDDKIIFGATCVKESMCHYFQTFFDKEKLEHDIIPYRSAELLVKKIYPEILEDERKIISLLLFSLSSINPGLCFYNSLLDAKINSKMNGYELYIHLMKSSMISDSKGDYNLFEYYIKSLDEFEETISWHLKSELQHIEEVFKTIRFSIEQKIIPVLYLLYDETLTENDIINNMVKYYGIPSIRSKDGTLHFPVGRQYEPSIDIVEILAQRIVLERLNKNYSSSGTCSLIQICQMDKANLIDDNCYGNQWEKESFCPFTVISKNWKLNEKINIAQ